MANWNDINAVFDAKAPAWNSKGSQVAVSGDDCPLDSYLSATIKEDSTVVDLGCGDGKALRKITRTWPHGTAILIDASRGMVTIAKRELENASGIRVIPIRADAARSPLPNSCADVVLLRQILQHVPMPQDVVREAARLLRPGGRVLIQVPGPEYLSDWDEFVSHATDAIGRFSQDELSVLFTRSGLHGTVTTHRFTFTFGNIGDGLNFFANVSLIDKLADYDPSAEIVIKRLLAKRMFRGLLSAGVHGDLTVGGEYLFGIGVK
jgi:SAM-dependent methyltransferase